MSAKPLRSSNTDTKQLNFTKHAANFWKTISNLGGVFQRKLKLDTETDWVQLQGRIVKKLEKRLKGYAPGNPNSFDDDRAIEIRPKREDFPVPGLVLFALGTFLKYPVVSRREEKTSWSIFGSLDETDFIVELRKSGFLFVFQEGTEDQITKRVVRQLGGAVSSIQKQLKPIVDNQIKNGNVTIPNRYHEFDDRYRFFRKKADEAYHDNGFEPDPADNELTGAMKRILHRQGTSGDGFYFTVEMVDAYFSLLEHILFLHFAFLNHFQERGQIVKFLRANWKIKFNTIVDVDQIQGSAKTLADLVAIKEAIRNPFAHGGTENDGSSLFVHLPGVGTVPASLNGFRNSLRFGGLLPIERGDFEHACKLFDKVDLLLANNGFELSQKMIVGGIEPAFDSASQQEYLNAMNSLQDVEEYVDAWNERWEQAANFD